MARHFSDEFKSELKRVVPILDLASKITTVRKFGNNFLGTCPFHNDTGAPNLQIDPVGNTFYCHSCAAGSRGHHKIKSSDVISFAMHSRNIGFYQAVETLANEYGIPLPSASPQEEKEAQLKAQYQERLMANLNRYRLNLNGHQDALKYLMNRGINKTEIDRWGLGFGDDVDENFKNTQSRVTFPIYDYFGNLVSFTGRIIFSSEMLEVVNAQREAQGKNPIVKYRDAVGFAKSSNLFGIHVAKDSIRSWGVAIIVEGWTDVISLHSRGATNAVSTMGVALSDTQVEMMKRAGAKSAIIMRDGDAAGQAATERDAAILLKHGIKPFVFPILEGRDPDDFARMYSERDSSLTREIHERKMTYNQWIVLKNWRDNESNIFLHLSQAHEMNMNRRELVLKNLLSIQDPVERNSLVDTVAALLLVTKEEVVQMMQRMQAPVQTVSFGITPDIQQQQYNFKPAFA